MDSLHSPAAQAAFAQPLTEDLLADAGVTPGMRVLVLGRDLADLALLVAERVGPTGAVLGLTEHCAVAHESRRRAADEGFDRVEFRRGSLEELLLDQPVDAAIGRFFLMNEPDPAQSIRRVAAGVRAGGRIIFQEWHYDSVRWPHSSDWPRVPLYRDFARWSLESFRRRRVSVDVGLRLTNLFTEAGLPVPNVRTDLRVVNGCNALGYAFFESTLRELLPTIERCGLAHAYDVEVDTFAQRLQRETIAAGGHVFLPLQVGAWTRC